MYQQCDTTGLRCIKPVTAIPVPVKSTLHSVAACLVARALQLNNRLNDILFGFFEFAKEFLLLLQVTIPVRSVFHLCSELMFKLDGMPGAEVRMLQA